MARKSNAERRERRRIRSMKYLDNSPLTGRKGVVLTISKPRIEDGEVVRADDGKPIVDQVPTTPRSLFRLIAENMPRDKTSTDVFRKINAALDAMDEQDEADAPLLTLEDEHYQVLKARLDAELAQHYGIHSPFVADALEERVKAGPALAEAEKVADGAD